MILFLCFASVLHAQSWQEWGRLPESGVYPRMVVGPDHQIYVGMLGTGAQRGVVYRASTVDANGVFTALPPCPFPTSIQNNIGAMVVSAEGDLIVGIFRSNPADPFAFRFDHTTQTWETCTVDVLPNLGAIAAARSPNGTLWLATKWSAVYKSTDGGRSFTRIDETPIIAARHACYYPTWNGNATDGAVYSVHVDARGTVYLGTECAGVVVSTNDGTTWDPLDAFACTAAGLKDSTSAMRGASLAGNVGGIGTTSDGERIVFCGAQMWTLGWDCALAVADLQTRTVQPAEGFPTNFITTGLQVSKIVTTTDGRMYLHSGSTASASGTVGIYTSRDAMHWSLDNDGITSGNTAQAQGSLAVDGNDVFMTTTDGRVYRHRSQTTSVNDATLEAEQNGSTEDLFILLGVQVATMTNGAVSGDLPHGLYLRRDRRTGRSVLFLHE